MLELSERVAKLRAEIAELHQAIIEKRLDTCNPEADRARRELRLREIMEELKDLANPQKFTNS